MLVIRVFLFLFLIFLAYCLPAQMIITGVFDAQPGASGAKGAEVYVTEDIADASIYEMGSANNGSGNTEGEFTFPEINLDQGRFIYLAADSAKFHEFFGFEADFITGAMNINGNDAIILLEEGRIIDVYGEPDVDGEGAVWEYTDGWAYRKNGRMNNTTFNPEDWTISGVDALEGGVTNNEAPIPFPLAEYREDNRPQLRDDSYLVLINDSLFFDPLANDIVSIDTMNTVEIIVQSLHSASLMIDEPEWLYLPDSNYCGLDSFDYRICNQQGCDTARVRIEIDCNDGLPLYSISDINGRSASGEADSVDVDCRLRGIVHSIDYRETGHSFFIQDEADAGILAFTNFDTGIEIEIGQQLEILGTIGQFNGQLQIFIDSLELISTDNPLFGPQLVSELGEETEGIFITMDSVSLINTADWRGDGSAYNVTATIPSGYEFTIRIDEATVFSDLPAPQGTFTLQGIGSQFDRDTPLDEGYQVLPRILEDIQPFDTAFTYNEYSIAELRESDFAGQPVRLGEKVTTTGVPVGVNYNLNGASWALMDPEDSSGIFVFDFGDNFGFMNDFNSGEYRVSGTLDQFNGLTQIMPDRIDFEQAILSPLQPILVTALNEETESQWIQMENLRIADLADWTPGAGGGGFNLDFIDEAGETVPVRVDADIALFQDPYPFMQNDLVRLIGIGGQFDRDVPYNEGYQLLVYDIEIMTSTNELNNSEFKAYPTICTDRIFLKSPGSGTYEIFDASGAMLRKGNLLAGRRAVKLQGLGEGWHFVRLSVGEQTVVKKFLLVW